MHLHESIVSLLTRRHDWLQRLERAVYLAGTEATAAGTQHRALELTMRALCAPYEPTARDILKIALDKLRERANERGVQMPDGIELRAAADLVHMDWGKSELQGDRLTLRLVATHASMPRDPVAVEFTLAVDSGDRIL